MLKHTKKTQTCYSKPLEKKLSNGMRLLHANADSDWTAMGHTSYSPDLAH